jgi:ribonuclease HII
MNLFEFDSQYFSDSIRVIAGADEVGRGPWAGSVVASVVILPKTIPQNLNSEIADLNDSKKVPKNKRENLAKIIKDMALAYSISFVDENIIDETNILVSTKRAIENCMADIFNLPNYKNYPDILLIDGNYKINYPIKQESIIKGDSKSASIASASILAKVARDEYMLEMDAKYPEYKFSEHKGYGTKLHREMLLKYGPCPIHRKSFSPVSNFFDKQSFLQF